MIADFIEVITAWLTGMTTWISSTITSITALFYTSGVDGGFTFLGMLALFGLAVGLVYFAINFVRSLLIK